MANLIHKSAQRSFNTQCRACWRDPKQFRGVGVRWGQLKLDFFCALPYKLKILWGELSHPNHPLPQNQGMRRTHTAWAIQRPDKALVTSMIRTSRLDAINAFREHLRRYQKTDPWRTAQRNGFKAVRVCVISLIEV